MLHAERPGSPSSTPDAQSASDAPSSTSGARSASGRWGRILTILPVIMALAGAAVLAYPVIATRHNNDEQQRIASQYSATVAATGEDTLAQQVADAELYNEILDPAPILDPWIETERPDSSAYTDYLAELDFDDAMSRIVIPAIHVDLPVYHGTEPATLEHGVGHLFGTSLPVGGTSTHTVLTGHTGLGSATLFDNLTKVGAGDTFYLMTAGRTLAYEVFDTRVVEPTDTSSLNLVPGEDLVTLITCTPYGVNSHRLLVTGRRTAVEPGAAAQEIEDAAPGPIELWMVALISAVVIILVVLVAVGVRAVVRRIIASRE